MTFQPRAVRFVIVALLGLMAFSSVAPALAGTKPSQEQSCNKTWRGDKPCRSD